MLHSQCALFLLLACDLPNLQPSSLVRLILAAEGFDAVVPRTPDGFAHPLCAVYRKTCLLVIEDNLRKGRNRATDIFASSPLHARWLGCEEGGFCPEDLVNLNSPEDLSAFGDRINH